MGSKAIEIDTGSEEMFVLDMSKDAGFEKSISNGEGFLLITSETLAQEEGNGVRA